MLPAEIAEALDDVVDVRRLVFGVTREGDEVVELAQLVARLERLEVVVGEVVRRLAGDAQPAEDRARRSGGSGAARRCRGRAV